MILFLNLIINPESQRHFDSIIIERIRGDLTLPYLSLHAKETIPDLNKFTHLIISGSELSAAVDNPSDKYVFSIIGHFINYNKPVLGICYGHQLLAKFLAGNEHCRKAVKPEFGWKELELRSDHLFKDLSHSVFLLSHYDEVFALPDNFRILGTSSDCSVQAFRYQDKPFWGVQFHPEYQFEDGNRLITRHFNETPEDSVHYQNDLSPGMKTENSLKIFRNFFTWNTP